MKAKPSMHFHCRVLFGSWLLAAAAAAGACDSAADAKPENTPPTPEVPATKDVAPEPDKAGDAKPDAAKPDEVKPDDAADPAAAGDPDAPAPTKELTPEQIAARDAGLARVAAKAAEEAKAAEDAAKAEAAAAKGDAKKTTKTADKAPSINAKPLYDKHCKVCHAPDGKGTAAMQKNKIPDMSDKAWQSKNSKAAVVKGIAEGVSGTKMKAFKDKMSKDEIDAVAAFVKRMK